MSCNEKRKPCWSSSSSPPARTIASGPRRSMASSTSRWCHCDQNSLPTETSGPGAFPPVIALTVRRPLKRMICSPAHARARWSRTTGSAAPAATADDGDHGVVLAHEVALLGQEGGAALEAEHGHRHPPAVADGAEREVRRGARAIEEDLVELGLSGELADRPDLHAGLVQRAQQEAQPTVAGCIRIGAGTARRSSRRTGRGWSTPSARRRPSRRRRGRPGWRRWRDPSRRPARCSPGTRTRHPGGSPAGSGASARRCRG